MFGYVPGGYKKVIEMFKQKLLAEGVNVRTNYAAREVRTSSSGKPSIDFGNGTPQEFDEVIVTLPSGIAAKLCKELSETEIRKLNDVGISRLLFVLPVLLDKPISPLLYNQYHRYKISLLRVSLRCLLLLIKKSISEGSR
jgi:protoporphyrinogen oxidase